MLEKLKEYFANTPREQVEADWAAAKKNSPKGIHTFKVLDEQEVMSDRSSAYQFINFDNPPHKSDNKNSEAC